MTPVRVPRIHVEAIPEAGGTLALPAAAADHVVRVLRLATGDALELFDGRGRACSASIVSSSRNRIGVAIGEEAPPADRESPLHITLAQAIARGEKMDAIVRMATELGVARFVPLATARSGIRLDDERAARRTGHWRAVAIAACEQCGRNRLPALDPPVRLDEFLADATRQPGLKLVFAPDGARGIADLRVDSGVTVAIGPEGGFASEEIERLRGGGFEAIRLGPRILRTETAGAAVLAALQSRFGDLG